jgi:hypothetical protein
MLGRECSQSHQKLLGLHREPVQVMSEYFRAKRCDRRLNFSDMPVLCDRGTHHHLPRHP